MTVAQRSLDASIRHQVFIERLKAGEVKNIIPFLREIDRELRLRLTQGNLSEFNRYRVETLIAEVAGLMTAALTRWSAGLRDDLFRFGVSEARFEARALSSVGFESIVPADAQVMAAIRSSPMSVRGATGGQLLTPFIAGYTASQVEAVSGLIRRAAFEGQTNQQVIQAIRGTKALKYKDGLLDVSRRQAEAIVRTAMQHVSSVARLETFAVNGVEKYEWHSTLDDRTSEICQGLSGTVWESGKGPLPPAHIRCRSTVVPVLGPEWDFLQEGRTQSAQFGPVDADQTYFDWLKNQTAKFQDEAIGPVRGKLLRDGGLSADQFQKLRLSRDFKPLTLAEMERLEPLAFERAGIKLDPVTGRVRN